MIEMEQINVATVGIKEFPVIEEAPDLDIFLGIIYTTVSKFLAAMSIII